MPGVRLYAGTQKHEIAGNGLFSSHSFTWQLSHLSGEISITRAGWIIKNDRSSGILVLDRVDSDYRVPV